MKIETEFKKAFFLSAMLHFLIIGIFNIKLIPSSEKLRKESQLFFYGSSISGYLVETVNSKEAPVCISNLDKRVRSFITENPFFSFDNVYDKNISYLKLDNPLVVLVDNKKIVPHFRGAEVDLDSDTKTDVVPRQDLSLDSYLKNFVLLKSPFSEITFSEDEENFNFKMRILISVEGKIEFIEPLFFSGKPELDILVKKSIKEWGFLPYGDLSGWYELTFSPKLVSLKKSL